MKIKWAQLEGLPYRGDTQPRYIVASAIIYKGTMYLGKRHHNCLRQAYLDHNEQIRQDADGFVDNFMNFLTREEALKLAIETGQAKSHNGRELYSEDLW